MKLNALGINNTVQIKNNYPPQKYNQVSFGEAPGRFLKNPLNQTLLALRMAYKTAKWGLEYSLEFMQNIFRRLAITERFNFFITYVKGITENLSNKKPN